MPSHQERVKKNYQCIFCKGTGSVLLTNIEDPNDVQAFTCGSCNGRGTTLNKQQSRLDSIEEVKGY